MSDYHEADTGDDAVPYRKTMSPMQIMLIILGALTMVPLAIRVLLLSVSAAFSPPATPVAQSAADNPTAQPIVTLASALYKYKLADAACEKAALGVERSTGTVDSAIDACVDSLQAVSDLPAIYGPPADALQSCIEMEGARVSGLNMVLAMREHRGDFDVDMNYEVMYRKKFHVVSISCNSGLAQINHDIGTTS